jgi:hypothetical protein
LDQHRIVSRQGKNEDIQGISLRFGCCVRVEMYVRSLLHTTLLMLIKSAFRASSSYRDKEGVDVIKLSHESVTGE